MDGIIIKVVFLWPSYLFMAFYLLIFSVKAKIRIVSCLYVRVFIISVHVKMPPKHHRRRPKIVVCSFSKYLLPHHSSLSTLTKKTSHCALLSNRNINHFPASWQTWTAHRNTDLVLCVNHHCNWNSQSVLLKCAALVDPLSISFSSLTCVLTRLYRISTWSSECGDKRDNCTGIREHFLLESIVFESTK